MVNKSKFYDNVIFYCIPQLLVIGIILLISSNGIVHIARFATGVKETSILYAAYDYVIKICLFAMWLLLFLSTIRSRHYLKSTGRSLRKDMSYFKKSYTELQEFFSKNDPYRMNLDTLPVEDWHTADGIILCKSGKKLVKRESTADGNACCFGLPGSGKSTCQAATSAARFRHGQGGVFAISIKGDLLNFVKEKRPHIKVFTPDRADGSCHFDPLAGIQEMSLTERRSYIETLSINICPEESGENAAFFVNGARDYFCAITNYLCDLHASDPTKGNLSFPEIVDTILLHNVFDITNTIHSSPSMIARQYSDSYIGSSEKNVAGTYNHLARKIRPFNSGALRTLFDGKGDCISADDLNNGDVYIDIPQDKFEIYAPAMRIIIANFLMDFMRKDDVSKNKDVTPILFLLDEAPQIKLDFSILSQSMSTLRSKKISIFLLMQSIAQLEVAYGEAHAREIIDLCAYISVFNAQDPKSREFFSKLVGKRRMLKKTENDNKNTSGYSITETLENIIEPAAFGDLSVTDRKGHKQRRVLVYANGKYILGEPTPCYE